MRNFEDINRNWTYSYSGADCRVYLSENNGEVILLNSLATASLSVHEAKAPVRALGRKAVSGFTESLRTIAGSLVFLILEDHPLSSVKDHKVLNKNYSLDNNITSINKGVIRKLSTLLNPVDLYFIYKTEVSSGSEQSEMWIKGVRFINEGIVTSVNDMVTEVVMQFVAEDVKPFQYSKKEAFGFTTEVKAEVKEDEEIFEEPVAETKAKEEGEVILTNASEISDAEKLKNLGTQIVDSIPFYNTGK